MQKTMTHKQPDGLPWDVKSVKISLGGDCDCDGWITLTVFDDSFLTIDFDGVDWHQGESSDNKTLDEVPLSVGIRIRDLLNYALPR